MIGSISFVLKKEMKDEFKDQLVVHPRVNTGCCVDKVDEKVLDGTSEARRV